MALGAAFGCLLGSAASPLGELGRVVIQLIKTLAAPLLFFAVADAFMRTRISGRSALTMLGISAVNASLALLIGLTLSNVLQPGALLRASMATTRAADPRVLLSQPAAALAPPTQATLLAGGSHKINFVEAFTGLVPTSITQPFAENSVVGVILLAILFGLAFRRLEGPHRRAAEAGVGAGLRATEIALGWIVRLVPLAVFGVVAKTIGTQGFAPLQGLAVYVATALGGLCIQVFVVYQAWLALVFGPGSLVEFWRGARDAVVYALGASSSLATLPVTLKCLDRMGVSTESSRLAACVGTNLNHDGILLYEAMAVLFVAQYHGIHLSVAQQALAAASCLVAGIGIAGIPDAGLISLSLVLTTVGLPLEILPMLLTVDWLLSRGRAATNVVSDMVLSRLLDRL